MTTPAGITPTPSGTTPVVLFVCVKNGGKSQMAAAMLTHLAAQSRRSVEVHSAGTLPGAAVNAQSAAAVAEGGADMTGQVPKPVDQQLLARADRVVVLGREARLQPVPGMHAAGVEIWDTDEPSTRGIEGHQRMRLIRDDITARCRQLLDGLS